MNAETRKLPISPEYQAWEDWRAEGAFFSSQFHGAERDRYRAETQRIEREMDQ